MTRTPPQPTAGQRHVLQLLCRVNYVLIGSKATPTAQPAYRLCERGTGRVIHTYTLTMVASLKQRGWIEVEHVERDDTAGLIHEWTYHVTQAGLYAANGPL